jgi:PAS domain S-box-containing protein
MTERKQMEEKLQISEQRLRLMIESAKDHAIIMLDPAGRVIRWNAGAQRLKGYTSEEIIGRHISIFYPEEKKAQAHANQELIEAAEKGRYEEEDWRRRKDGSLFWASITLNAMRNREGELIGFVKITRDVTARREAEERIQRLNEQLLQRADMLQAANKELESFSYSVSHDLRAPLRHIHGFVEMLQHNPAFEKDAGAHRQMAVIARAAKEMGRLIDDLLDFSRTSRAEMHPVSIDMNAMVAQAIRDAEVDIAGRQIAWDIQQLSPAAGDPPLLRLVWVNLIANAIKYTRPKDEARIEIGEQPAEPGSREHVYYVRDNGVGFDMQYAGKLFGVFQRLHRAEDFEGTGIGLANVQRIILRHGGRVWAESKPNAGATFFFSLPTTPNPVTG